MVDRVSGRQIGAGSAKRGMPAYAGHGGLTARVLGMFQRMNTGLGVRVMCARSTHAVLLIMLWLAGFVPCPVAVVGVGRPRLNGVIGLARCRG